MNFKLILVIIICIILGIIFINKFLRREKVNGGYLSKFTFYGNDGNIIGSAVGLDLSTPIPVLRYFGAKTIISKNNNIQYYISALFKDLNIINISKDPLQYLIDEFNRENPQYKITSYRDYGKHNLLFKMFRINNTEAGGQFIKHASEYGLGLVTNKQTTFDFEVILQNCFKNSTFTQYVLNLLDDLMKILKDDAFIADVTFIGQLIGEPKDERGLILNAIAKRQVVEMKDENFPIETGFVVKKKHKNEPSVKKPPPEEPSGSSISPKTQKRGRPKGSKNKSNVDNDQNNGNKCNKPNSGGCLWVRTHNTVGGCPPESDTNKIWYRQVTGCNVCADCALHNLLFIKSNDFFEINDISTHVYFPGFDSDVLISDIDFNKRFNFGENHLFNTGANENDFTVSVQNPFSSKFNSKEYVWLIENIAKDEEVGHWIGYHNGYIYDSQYNGPMTEAEWFGKIGNNPVYMLFYKKIHENNLETAKSVIEQFDSALDNENGSTTNSYDDELPEPSRTQYEGVIINEDNNNNNVDESFEEQNQEILSNDDQEQKTIENAVNDVDGYLQTINPFSKITYNEINKAVDQRLKNYGIIVNSEEEDALNEEEEIHQGQSVMKGNENDAVCELEVFDILKIGKTNIINYIVECVKLNLRSWFMTNDAEFHDYFKYFKCEGCKLNVYNKDLKEDGKCNDIADIYPAEDVALFLIYISFYYGRSLELRNNYPTCEMVAAYLTYVYMFNSVCSCVMEKKWNTSLSNEYVYKKENINGHLHRNDIMKDFKNENYNDISTGNNMTDLKRVKNIISLHPQSKKIMENMFEASSEVLAEEGKPGHADLLSSTGRAIGFVNKPQKIMKPGLTIPDYFNNENTSKSLNEIKNEVNQLEEESKRILNDKKLSKNIGKCQKIVAEMKHLVTEADDLSKAFNELSDAKNERLVNDQDFKDASLSIAIMNANKNNINGCIKDVTNRSRSPARLQVCKSGSNSSENQQTQQSNTYKYSALSYLMGEFSDNATIYKYPDNATISGYPGDIYSFFIISDNSLSPPLNKIAKVFNFSCDQPEYQKQILDVFVRISVLKNDYIIDFDKMTFNFNYCMAPEKTGFMIAPMTPAFFSTVTIQPAYILENILSNRRLQYDLKFNSLRCICDVAKGMYYLHSCLCFHGNLCPFNVIFNNGKFKIWNFGLNSIYSKYHVDSDVCDKSFRSPRFKKCDDFKFKDDVYSFGVLMAYIFIKTKDKNNFNYTPQGPFNVNDIKEHLDAISNKGDFEKLIYDCLNFYRDEKSKKYISFKDIVEKMQPLVDPEDQQLPQQTPSMMAPFQHIPQQIPQPDARPAQQGISFRPLQNEQPLISTYDPNTGNQILLSPNTVIPYTICENTPPQLRDKYRIGQVIRLKLLDNGDWMDL